MLGNPRSYEEACRTFRWRIPDRYNLAFDVCDRQTMAGADGHRTALVVEAADGSVQRFTFQVLRQLSNRLANVLRGHGVGSGDRVAVALAPGIEAALAVLAVTRMGAIAVPVPTRLGAEPLGWRLAHSGAVAALVDGSVLPALSLARADLPGLRLVLATETGPGVTSLWTGIERAADAFDPMVTPADHPAFIAYPSHGCGHPPGVMLSHAAMAGGLPAVEMALGLFPQFGDVAWTAGDWMEVENLLRLVLPAWHHGVPVVVGEGWFDPERALGLLSRHGVRAAQVPSVLLGPLCRAAAGKPHSILRALASGPAPLSEDDHEQAFKAFGIHANDAWGVPETGAVAANLAGLMELRPPSPGRAAPGLTVEAVDERGRPLPAGERGILAVPASAPGNFLGYWGGGPAGPARRLGRWLLTGRFGSRDIDNYIWPEPPALPMGCLVGPGAMVDPVEVEAVLTAHPAVCGAAVVEWPQGELRAFVELAGATPPGLDEDLKGRVGLYRGIDEIPRRIDVVESLPRGPEGAVLRQSVLDSPLRLDAPSRDDRWGSGLLKR